MEDPAAKKIRLDDQSGGQPNVNDGSGDKGDFKQLVDDRSRNCPYLDTINRNHLDFDFEKLCSVSLSKINVYACLVCGKYFQGRGIGTHAYIHSVSVDHHVFLNLSSLRFYCLPDNYEIVDSSLDDITYVLKPTFTSKDIAKIDRNEKKSRAFDGTLYLPGIVGLNNIKANDYCNVVLHSLAHVSPIRNYFLKEENYIKILQSKVVGDNETILVQRWGELVRKLWNGRNFKAHVSPHEMLQAVVLCSNKKFQITKQEDPINFLSWFLNCLHSGLNGTKKDNSSIIYASLRGAMKIYSRKVMPLNKSIDEKLSLMETDEYKKESCQDSNFLYLTLELPPPPLFKDELRENIIPQVPLSDLLARFDGKTEKEYSTYKDSQLRRFQLTRMPKYLILYIKRFTKNTFFKEKNPTIVNFPVKDLDLTDLIPAGERENQPKPVYDLIANIVHEGEPEAGKGSYRAHIFHRATSCWFELQDLHVTEVLPQMIPLSESYIQIWERQTTSQ